MKNYKLKLAHWIASSELQAEQSRRNRSFRKMAVAYIVNSLIKILDDEKIWKSERQRQVLIALFESYAEDMIYDVDTVDDKLAAVALLVRNGYTVSYEAPPIGKTGTGVYLHVTDELKDSK
jgi:hypothetical protein